MAAKKVFIPADTSAVAIGAGEVAAKFQSLAKKRGAGIEVVRNGSRGAFSIEPLVEAETTEGRVAWGPVSPKEAEAVFDSVVNKSNTLKTSQG
jgi:formate dehydrogenase iron-sulfur subunit